MDEAQWDRQRVRWERVRAGLHLTDPRSEDFGTGGLARRVDEPSVRLLLLPPDPEGTLLDFTSDFWAWWRERRADPATGSVEWWAREHEPTAGAAVCYTRGGNTQDGKPWGSYLALHRTGGLEMELGSDGATTGGDEQRYFRLTYAVGQVWYGLALFQEVIARVGLQGPWEMTVALQKTKGALLSHFAAGWAEPRGGAGDSRRNCLEPNLLFRYELPDWPDAEGLRDLAFRVGGWIEDAWGNKERRFLAQGGPFSGNFDPIKYQRG